MVSLGNLNLEEFSRKWNNDVPPSIVNGVVSGFFPNVNVLWDSRGFPTTIVIPENFPLEDCVVVNGVIRILESFGWAVFDFWFDCD
jgi:hypothetical protein